MYDQITFHLNNTPYLYLFCLKFVNQPVPVSMLVLGVRNPERASARNQNMFLNDVAHFRNPVKLYFLYDWIIYTDYPKNLLCV